MVRNRHGAIDMAVEDSESEAIGVAILGAGPAGLACGWAMEEAGDIGYCVFEKSSVHGGNARTVKAGEFLYDTGPDRFHARDENATRRIGELLGAELATVSAPARICWKGKFVDFPLRPFQILKGGGLWYTLRASFNFMMSRIFDHRSREVAHFADYAKRRFGKTIAETFLIPFSERLWGMKGSELSPDIAGRRLPGFSVLGLMKDLLFGAKSSDHLEGRFLYPRLGYGQISDRMADKLSKGNLLYGKRVIGFTANDDRIVRVRINDGGTEYEIKPEVVINTLPITQVVQMLEPTPPQEVLDAVGKLRFRDVVLVILFLDVPSVSDAAVTYFQNAEYEFSRAHEPRNRSSAMSPEGKTSLVVEFPCFQSEEIWMREDSSLIEGLVSSLHEMGLIDRSAVIDADVHRLPDAYPVYFNGYGEVSEVVLNYLAKFGNLWSLGRGGSYFYGHVHDFITEAADVIRAVESYRK